MNRQGECSGRRDSNHLIGGPAATVPSALISGLIAGAIIGAGQGVALGILHPAGIWRSGSEQPPLGLGIALAAVTGVIGQIDTMTDAILLGAISGLAIGAGQAAFLSREGVANAWIWVVTLGTAWAIGWAVTASIGVALEASWPVFGLSGALVSQGNRRDCPVEGPGTRRSAPSCGGVTVGPPRVRQGVARGFCPR